MCILYNVLANGFVFRYSSSYWYPFCLPWWHRVSKSGIAGQFGTIIVLGAHYVFCIQKWSYVKSVNSLAYRLGGLFEGCHGVSTCRWSPLPGVASKTLSAGHVGWGKVAPILPMCVCKCCVMTIYQCFIRRMCVHVHIPWDCRCLVHVSHYPWFRSWPSITQHYPCDPRQRLISSIPQSKYSSLISNLRVSDCRLLF